LSTFDWDQDRLVEVAVGMMLASIEARPPRRRRVLIHPTFRQRSSTARCQPRARTG
jgi:DNA-binding LacI/PurR family transcriptional regulator